MSKTMRLRLSPNILIPQLLLIFGSINLAASVLDGKLEEGAREVCENGDTPSIQRGSSFAQPLKSAINFSPVGHENQEYEGGRTLKSLECEDTLGYQKANLEGSKKRKAAILASVDQESSGTDVESQEKSEDGSAIIQLVQELALGPKKLKKIENSDQREGLLSLRAYGKSPGRKVGSETEQSTTDRPKMPTRNPSKSLQDIYMAFSRRKKQRFSKPEHDSHQAACEFLKKMWMVIQDDKKHISPAVYAASERTGAESTSHTDSSVEEIMKEFNFFLIHHGCYLDFLGRKLICQAVTIFHKIGLVDIKTMKKFQISAQNESATRDLEFIYLKLFRITGAENPKWVTYSDHEACKILARMLMIFPRRKHQISLPLYRYSSCAEHDIALEADSAEEILKDLNSFFSNQKCKLTYQVRYQIFKALGIFKKVGLVDIETFEFLESLSKLRRVKNW